MGGYRKFSEIMYTLPAKSSIRSEFKYFEILKILKKINYMKEVKNIFCKITMPKSYEQITKKKLSLSSYQTNLLIFWNR